MAGLMVGVLLAPSFAADPPAPWKIPGFKARKANPVAADDASITQGKTLFTQLCAMCHGEKGHGDGPVGLTLTPHPADLGRAEMREQSDGELFWKITEGRAPMPTFGPALSEEQRWHLINYVRTFNAPAPSHPKYTVPTAYRDTLTDVIKPYLAIGAALADAAGQPTSDQWAMLAKAETHLQTLDGADLDEAPAKAWRQTAAQLHEAIQQSKQAKDKDAMKHAYDSITKVIAEAVQRFGHTLNGTLVLYSCPDAFDGHGAVWLQSDNSQTQNIYHQHDDDCPPTPMRYLAGI
ncbi:DUF3347 domain-containing protein [Planctomycetales bacterium ZRK34]|nr:DUF3347 domain-containing protein [Planctomycetales bacterium ZRK34]